MNDHKSKLCLASLICLFLSSAHALAGLNEWQKHMDAAVEAFGASDYAKAEQHYEDAVSEGEDEPDELRLAESLNGLGVTYREQGRYTEAEPLLKRALSIKENTLDAAHPDVVQSLNNLARLYLDQGRTIEADRLLKRPEDLDAQTASGHARRVQRPDT